MVDHDEDMVRLASRRGYLAVRGDVADGDLLERIGVPDRVQTLICVTGDDVKNVFLTLSARRMNQRLCIIARANRKEVVRKLTLAGADHVVSPHEIFGLMGAEYVGRPVAFEAFRGILHGDTEVILEAVRVAADSPLNESKVGDMDFPAKRLLLFGVISAADRTARCGGVHPLADGNCFYFKPGEDFTLQAGDMLIMFGHEVSLQHFRHAVGELESRMGRR